ncbi:unnamed protein product [Oppiella nova]|uniref:Uncharacterized protein n=1 Tax=Oppiella nova TaxID=334625 RepID=A0A7R9MBT1_9ACAR|nr:unnamed protein product [Oppiella nova]CAG2174261.1 unnamed protein product [Oppiella nova]
MSGPNVVDKAKMVFHYVAKIAARPPNSADTQDSNREMKVCFRHSKHSIKCDANAPCLECDSGLKLYSYEQCRRHLDVVRSEKRFESIEVDRSENMIEKLSDIDDNGRKVALVLDAILAKEEALLKALADRQPLDEAINCSLKEISRNGLKSQKRVEELCERLDACHRLLETIGANTALVATNQTTGNAHFTQLCAQMEGIGGHVTDATAAAKDWRSDWTAAQESAREHREAALAEARDTRTAVTGVEAALERQLVSLRESVREECESARRHLADCETALRAQVLAAIGGVREEVRAVGAASAVVASELKESLPEKLMDVFGGILMLSADSSRRMDDTSEHVINSL